MVCPGLQTGGHRKLFDGHGFGGGAEHAARKKETKTRTLQTGETITGCVCKSQSYPPHSGGGAEGPANDLQRPCRVCRAAHTGGPRQQSCVVKSLRRGGTVLYRRAARAAAAP